ncbi:chlorite dismutase family protein [Bacillus altitudinis]|uniref:chlorite dismutase family protein n=1 Tax=Bacillus altitudinis TaxID=293387 RepID=UPI003B52AD2D
MHQPKSLITTHPLIRRTYPPKLKHIITPSLPFHHYHSPLTLFPHHLLQFKKLLYQIPFHELTAPYRHFPSFFLPNPLPNHHLPSYFHLS